jgi:hypothetical protein
MNNCKICKLEIPKHRTYCSNKCKFSDDSYNKRRINPKKNDKNYYLECKLCSKKINDVLNTSGAPTVHLKNEHDIETNNYLDFYIKKKHPEEKKWTCPICKWTTTDILNKSGCITVHIRNNHNMELLEFNELHKENAIVTSNLELLIKKLNMTEDDYITCELCGERMSIISNTHCMHKHGITQQQYKDKFGDCIISKSMSKILQPCGGSNGIYKSKGENEVYDFIKSLGIDVIQTYKKLRFEIDIFVPQFNIGIEFNGLYWHSEYRSGRGKNYHLNKTKICERNGIQLIHVFEDEWLKHKDIIKARLIHIFNKSDAKSIFARKCQVKEIDKKIKSEFLNKYHLQGNDRANILLGAFYNDELVAVATFSGNRIALGSKEKGGYFELNRFAINYNFKIPGIFSKLIKYFERNYNPKRIITYADRRYSTKDNIYDKAGFNFVSETKPNYFYTKNYSDRLHRYNFTKHRIINKFGGDVNLTEWENMLLLGYDRLWDVGNLKYELNLEK